MNLPKVNGTIILDEDKTDVMYDLVQTCGKSYRESVAFIAGIDVYSNFTFSRKDAADGIRRITVIKILEN